MALDAADVYERLGSSEGELTLAQCVVYLAVAPKSNAVYTAYKQVRALVKKDGTRPVPLHLRNAPTSLMKDLDYGKNYRYAHDEEDAFAAGENYFPEGLENSVFYQPQPRGLEIRIALETGFGKAGKPLACQKGEWLESAHSAAAPCKSADLADFLLSMALRHRVRARRARTSCTFGVIYGYFCTAGYQWPGAGQHVRAHRPGLHHGVRHH